LRSLQDRLSRHARERERSPGGEGVALRQAVVHDVSWWVLRISEWPNC